MNDILLNPFCIAVVAGCATLFWHSKLPSLDAKGQVGMLRLFRYVLLALPFTALTATTAFAEIQQITITGATLNNPGEVQVEGTVTCPAGESFIISSGTVRQDRHFVVSGAGGPSAILTTCTGAPQPWTLIAIGGPFSPGRAFVQVTIGTSSFDLTTTSAFVSLHPAH